jgi:hypothetical protein
MIPLYTATRSAAACALFLWFHCQLELATWNIIHIQQQCRSYTTHYWTSGATEWGSGKCKPTAIFHVGVVSHKVYFVINTASCLRQSATFLVSVLDTSNFAIIPRELERLFCRSHCDTIWHNLLSSLVLRLQEKESLSQHGRKQLADQDSVMPKWEIKTVWKEKHSSGEIARIFPAPNAVDAAGLPDVNMYYATY